MRCAWHPRDGFRGVTDNCLLDRRCFPCKDDFVRCCGIGNSCWPPPMSACTSAGGIGQVLFRCHRFSGAASVASGQGRCGLPRPRGPARRLRRRSGPRIERVNDSSPQPASFGRRERPRAAASGCTWGIPNRGDRRGQPLPSRAFHLVHQYVPQAGDRLAVVGLDVEALAAGVRVNPPLQALTRSITRRSVTASLGTRPSLPSRLIVVRSGSAFLSSGESGPCLSATGWADCVTV